MSSSNRNFIFAYAFLVILPLAALAGVLKSGRKLAAPPAIDGLWNFRFESSHGATSTCTDALVTLFEKTVSISQSGTTFVLSMPDDARITGFGTLSGTKLQAAFASSEPAAVGCAGHQQVLTADLDRKVGRGTLAGILSAPNCPSCAPLAFRDERASISAPGTPNKGDH